MSKFLSVSKKFLFIAAAVVSFAPPLAAEAPVFLSDLPNPNDFNLFANGGWDGNWYIGFNTCWVQKLTVPEGKYQKAFVGAKLGRMKNFENKGRPPWEKKAYSGELYMGISSTISWSKSQSFLLTATEDIPLEPDFESAVEGVGESRWFWKEIPIKLIEPGKEHFLALWSPTKEMAGISSSPILAAGYGSKEVDSWLNSEARGAPSTMAKALATPVTVFEPAIALKLIPACSSGTAPCPENPKVEIARVENGKARGREPASKIIWAAVQGQGVERAWAEVSPDNKEWVKTGRLVWNAPFVFTLRLENLPVSRDGKIWVRIAARDVYENLGTSKSVNLLEQEKK